jgi:hypothetical protein
MRIRGGGIGVGLLAVAAGVAVAVFSCPGSADAAKAKKDDLSSIRRQVAAIEKTAASLRRVERDLNNWELSTEGACLTACYRGKSLRKIVARCFGESGRAVEEFYFAGGSLVFVLRTSLLYDKPIGSPPYGTLSPRVVSTRSDRFYFKGGRLLRWVPPKKADFDWSTGSAREEERKILDFARRLRKEAGRAGAK